MQVAFKKDCVDCSAIAYALLNHQETPISCRQHERPHIIGGSEMDGQTLQMNDLTNPKDLVGLKKPRLSLVPPAGMVYAALAMANGADKYGPYNWREKKVQLMIYLEAAQRHILSFQDGEEIARDSGVPHLGHALACLLIIIDALETGNLVDNRPKAGPMADLIERYTKKEVKP